MTPLPYLTRIFHQFVAWVCRKTQYRCIQNATTMPAQRPATVAGTAGMSSQVITRWNTAKSTEVAPSELSPYLPNI